MGAQAGRLVVQLPLGADGATEHGRDQQPAEELEVAWHRVAPQPGFGPMLTRGRSAGQG